MIQYRVTISRSGSAGKFRIKTGKFSHWPWLRRLLDYGHNGE